LPLRIAFGIGLALLGVQMARLAFAALTPAGPLGQVVPAGSAPAADKVAQRFDPFFRAEAMQAGSATVTGLPLNLFGTRQDFATGRGSAIIATPDGVQSSFAVGEMVMPGAKLVTVAGDYVEIERGGTRERLSLDQSVPATTPAVPVAPVVAAPVQAALAPAPAPEAPR
jgi:general secretion pathway protein C